MAVMAGRGMGGGWATAFLSLQLWQILQRHLQAVWFVFLGFGSSAPPFFLFKPEIHEISARAFIDMGLLQCIIGFILKLVGL